MALGLIAVSLIIVGWNPVKAALADLVNADVLSLPGDASTGQVKAPFQRIADFTGSSPLSFDLEFPDAVEVRIETVTVEVRLPVGQSPWIILQTTVNGVQVGHSLAAQSQGTYLENGTVRQQFCGTHYVRLLSDREGENPPGIKVLFIRAGGTSAFAVCRVTISGYTTPLAPAR
jgi:hypothetical protein